MRLADITPGLIVAVPYDHAGSAAAKEGRNAVPAKVVSIGKFRFRHGIGCDPEIVEDGHRTVVRLSVFDPVETWGRNSDGRIDWTFWDKQMGCRYFGRPGLLPLTAPGMPDGPKLASKKLKWKEVLLDSQKVAMPWTQFIQENAEHRLAALETDAYTARRKDLVVAVQDILKGAVAPSLRPVDPTGFRISFYRDDSIMEVRFNLQVDDLIQGDKALAEYLNEIKDIDRRLSCRA